MWDSPSVMSPSSSSPSPQVQLKPYQLLHYLTFISLPEDVSNFVNKTENTKAEVDSRDFFLLLICLSFAACFDPKCSTFAISGNGKFIDIPAHCPHSSQSHFFFFLFFLNSMHLIFVVNDEYHTLYPGFKITVTLQREKKINYNVANSHFPSLCHLSHWW